LIGILESERKMAVERVDAVIGRQGEALRPPLVTSAA
jgi:hypothetical protein